LSLFNHHVCARSLSETGCAHCGAQGLIEGSLLRSASGWRPVEALMPHETLCVFPGGTVRLDGIEAEDIWRDPVDCPDRVRPLGVPVGALGNTDFLLLQQDMRVLFHDPDLDAALGTADVTIRAGDLIGFRGICPLAPPRRARLFRIALASEALLLVGGGVWLLYTPPICSLSRLAEGDGATSIIGGRSIRHLTAEKADVVLALQERRERMQDIRAPSRARGTGSQAASD